MAPREGYRSLTVKDELHDELEEEAERRKCSIPKLIYDLLEPLKKSQEGCSG